MILNLLMKFKQIQITRTIVANYSVDDPEDIRKTLSYLKDRSIEFDIYYFDKGAPCYDRIHKDVLRPDHNYLSKCKILKIKKDSCSVFSNQAKGVALTEDICFGSIYSVEVESDLSKDNEWNGVKIRREDMLEI